MVDFPSKFCQFEAGSGTLLLAATTTIVDQIQPHIAIINKIVLYGLFWIISVALIWHGLSQWFKSEHTEYAINEDELNSRTASLKLEIRSFNASWDLETTPEDEYILVESNATTYTFEVMIYNPSERDNIVKDLQVTSKKNGKCLTTFQTEEIKGRGYKTMQIHATLPEVHAEIGDEITILMKDLDERVLSVNKKIEEYDYSWWYKERFPEQFYED